ncbi:MAG: hypothetical protein LC750_00580 [Actinobacteria bacterium]|nr:hypothetical protein [Actinomycetota bacterium]
MPLFWIVHRVDGEPRVYIKEASAGLYARLEGAMAGILNPVDVVISLERRWFLCYGFA